MVTSPTPTRAEASDVATAIFGGADPVMLSAESAAGQYPVEAVAMMDRIIRRSEKHDFYQSLVHAAEPNLEKTPPHAAAAAAQLAETLSAGAVVAYTATGTTAMRVARGRPNLPILALTPSERVARQHTLLWGAHSLKVDEVVDEAGMVETANEACLEEGLVDREGLAVIVAGIPFGASGGTNNIRLVKIGPVRR